MAFKLIEKDKYILGFCEDILEEVFEELEMKHKHSNSKNKRMDKDDDNDESIRFD
jgi:hypothetical protein